MRQTPTITQLPMVLVSDALQLFRTCAGITCDQTIKADEEKLKDEIVPGIVHISSYHPYSDLMYIPYSTMIKERITDFGKRLCRGRIKKDYIGDIQDSNPSIILARMKDAEGNITYVGFAQYIPVDSYPDYNSHLPLQKQIMIETICTAIGVKGVGKAIMDYIITYARNRLNLDSIILDSLQEARAFYEKFGFTVDPTRPRPSELLVPMILPLQTRVKRGGRRTFRRYRKKRPGLF
jgi:hypothetical protein